MVVMAVMVALAALAVVEWRYSQPICLSYRIVVRSLSRKPTSLKSWSQPAPRPLPIYMRVYICAYRVYVHACIVQPPVSYQSRTLSHGSVYSCIYYSTIEISLHEYCKFYR